MRINKFSQSGTQNGMSQQGLNATLTGPLTLAGNPTGPLEATPKQYVDSAINSLNAINIKTGTLSVARLPAFTGDVSSATGSGNFVLNNTGVVAGSYTKVTVDSKGRVLSGSNITNDDIPPFNFSKIGAGKPNTIDGYGITDALKAGGSTVTGTLSLNLDPTNGLHAANKQYVDALGGNGVAITSGVIIRRPVETTPTGFLRTNGGQVSKTTYSALFAALTASYNNVVDFDYTSYSAMGAGQPGRQQYDFKKMVGSDLSDWTFSSLFAVSSASHQIFVTKNRAYAIGCGNGAAVYTAPIDAEGNLGTWEASTSTPANVLYSQVVVTKNKIHILGGQDSFETSNIYSATINADGTLGAWSNTGNLAVATARSQAIVTKTRVYLLGGSESANGVIATVQSAAVNADGTLGAWTVGTALPMAKSSAHAVVTKNRVYLVGGWDGVLRTNTIHTAPINSDGTLGAWTTTTNFPIAISNAATLVAKNRVFILGGTNNGPSLNSVYSAPINTDGTLGTWAAGSNMVLSLYNHSVIATKNKVYIIGGYSSEATAGNRNNVYKATFNGEEGLNDYSAFYNGTINKFDGSDISGNVTLYQGYNDTLDGFHVGAGQPWRRQYDINSDANAAAISWTTATSLPGALSASQAIVTKNRVYLLGGCDSSGSGNNAQGVTSVVYTAPINADGTLGAWTTSASLPYIISSSQVVMTKNRVYLLGGRNDNSYDNRVCTAPINADGTLGAWTLGTALPTTIADSQAFITKNRVYLITGRSSTGGGMSYTAPINNDGTLGTWTTGPAIPSGLEVTSIIVTKNRVYSLGNYMGSYSSTVYTAPINADGTIGTWVTGTSIPGALSFSQAVTTKNRVYLFGGADAGSPTWATYTAPINADGTLGTWASGTLLPANLSMSQIIVVKNKMYLLGGRTNVGSTSTTSTVYMASFNGGLTDYSAYYDGTINIPDPNNFKLPDFTSMESANEFFFIKT